MKPPDKRTDTELLNTLMLAERLLAPLATADTSGPPPPPPAQPSTAEEVIKSVRYWMWRAGRRKLRSPSTQALAEHYEREIASLTKRHEDEMSREAAREHSRVSALEQLAEQLQQTQLKEAEALNGRIAELERQVADQTRAHHEEVGTLRRRHAADLLRLRAEADADGEQALRDFHGEIDKAQARIAQLEEQLSLLPQTHDDAVQTKAALGEAQAQAAIAAERARVAENKARILKEAMGISPNRPSSVAPKPSSEDARRFREAKRAFALHFHPDQGGRENAEKEKLFLEFWPILERIEQGK